MNLCRHLVRWLAIAAAIGWAFPPGASAQGLDGGSQADAERAVQAYLAMWSHDGDVNRDAVARFYAPRVVYYGKAMSRAQVLEDKRAYIRRWPVRRYTEVPGSFSAQCNVDRSLCRVKADMAWRRVGDDGRASTGRARLSFDFVPSDGGRKIARESARIL